MRFDPERLDDPARLSDGDPSGMLRAVASSAAQVRTAYRAAVEADVARVTEHGRPRAIVVVGMGGAGIAGDVLDVVCGQGAPLPVLTARGYRLPGWVGAADLVMAVSRSGRTEETVAMATEAIRRGCSFMAVAAPDSPLHALASQAGAPFVPVVPVAPLVGSVAQPRATIWDLAVPLIVAASAFGLAEADKDLFETVAERLEDIAHRCRPSSDSFINPAKTLASELAGHIPMIWGSSHLSETAAYRLACQLNQNAKYPAVWGGIPEVGHNQVAALDGPLAGRDMFADHSEDQDPPARLRLFVLRDVEEHPLVVKRRQASVRLAQDRGVPVSEIQAEGVHPLERLATLIGLGDYASVYVALGYGIDPAPVSAIMELKARISQ